MSADKKAQNCASQGLLVMLFLGKPPTDSGNPIYCYGNSCNSIVYCSIGYCHHLDSGKTTMHVQTGNHVTHIT